jgi:AcrR family transcriptional regulator
MTDQSVSRKNQIMEVAKELFAEKDYHEVTLDDIAKTVGVAKGTLYLYFKSKADLFVQTFTKTLDNVISDLREIFNSGEDLTTTLSLIFDYYEDSIRRDKYFNRFGRVHRVLHGELSSDVSHKVKKTIFSRIEALENEAVDFLDAHLPGTKLDLGDLYQILEAISFEISQSQSDTIKDTAISLILDGIRKEETL